jgi:hypothetical protein
VDLVGGRVVRALEHVVRALEHPESSEISTAKREDLTRYLEASERE